MMIAGVTGGIGAGKSIVCKIFSILGIPVYNSDAQAKYLMQKDSNLIKKIKTHFGNQSYREGRLNRFYLSKTIFYDQSQLEVMNKIVHPVVATDFGLWVRSQSSAYVIKETALMVESGAYRNVNWLINVSSPLEMRISRVKARDAFRSEEEIQGIVAQQISEDRRIKLAHHVVWNDEKNLLIPQVIAIHKQLIQAV